MILRLCNHEWTRMDTNFSFTACCEWSSLVRSFRGRHKLSSGGRDRLARHIVAMEKLRRIPLMRSFLLARRAYFFRAGLLSPNKMQSVRANDSAPKNHLWHFYKSH